MISTIPTTDALEFHDSEVAELTLQGGDLVIRFSAAYVHRSALQPGVGEGAGFVQALEMRCLLPTMLEQSPGCMGGLWDGVLHVAGNRLALVPLPYETREPIALELSFASGGICKLQAQGMVLRAMGQAHFVEWFKC